jgi:hypothetical protein
MLDLAGFASNLWSDSNHAPLSVNTLLDAVCFYDTGHTVQRYTRSDGHQDWLVDGAGHWLVYITRHNGEAFVSDVTELEAM